VDQTLSVADNFDTSGTATVRGASSLQAVTATTVAGTALSGTTGSFAGNIHQSAGHSDLKGTTVTGALTVTGGASLQAVTATTVAGTAISGTTGNFSGALDTKGNMYVTGNQLTTGTLGVTGVASLNGGAKVGTSGTTRTGLISGSVSFPNGSTTASLAIAGLTASYKLIMAPMSAYSGSVYYKYAVPGTAAAVAAFSGDPGTTVTMGYEAWTQ